jgi:2-iminobutanoate/2-iminopropanoate deaminase
MTEKTAVYADNAPLSLWHYSQAIKLGEYVFISAQLPLDRAAKELCGKTCKEQATQCLDNITGILQIIGGQLSNILKMTVHVRSIADVETLDPILRERFAFVPPAMSFVEVARLPKDALVQIDAIAYIPSVQVKGGVLF